MIADSRCKCRIGAASVAGEAASGAPSPSVRCTAAACGAALTRTAAIDIGVGTGTGAGDAIENDCSSVGDAGCDVLARSADRSPSNEMVSGSGVPAVVAGLS